MTKFFKNLYRLLLVGTPLFIIFNYVKNFLPNYKSKGKSKKIEKIIYDKFKSLNSNEKWFCNNLNFLTNNFKDIKNIKDILEIGSYEGRSSIFFLKIQEDSSSLLELILFEMYYLKLFQLKNCHLNLGY